MADDSHFFSKLQKTLPDQNVSRETFSKLEQFIALLEKWNKKINLIRYYSTEELWERHILDCVQLLHLIPNDAKTLIDFGSGAGFPGIIISLFRPMEISLIESDERKCAFLYEASSLSLGQIHIHNSRIESLTPWESDVLTARALASLSNLIPLTNGFIKKTKICLFQKGQNSVEELDEAQKKWDLEAQIVNILGSPHSNIISIKGGRT
jgi:16S rRNA (guanine527-N7)-methyltransferase